MTDRDKMKKIIDSHCTFEGIVYSYLSTYSQDFSEARLRNIIRSLKNNYLPEKINKKKKVE